MSAVQATIDEETARKLDADRKAHGAAFSCVDADGTIVHIPAETMMPFIGPALAARLKRCARERYRIATVDTSWPTEHESDCPKLTGGDCRCPMGNL